MEMQFRKKAFSCLQKVYSYDFKMTESLVKILRHSYRESTLAQVKLSFTFWSKKLL